MDYCSTCRRTLNGVFVCPGCGAYAPDIAPAGSHVHHTPSTVAVMAEISHTREFDAFPGFAELETPQVPEADVPAGPATPSATGRAARRRRLADWKKQRRRAVVASTVALVGGGLTLAFMPSSRPSVSQAQASAPPPPVTPPTGSVGAETDIAPDTERPRTGGPRTSDSGSRPAGSVNSPGSATSTAPVDAPAKRETTPQTTPNDTRPTAEPQPEPPSTAPTTQAPTPPPTAEQPTPQPNRPTSPAQPPPPPPPTAEPPQDDSSELCLLVLCVGLDAGN